MEKEKTRVHKKGTLSLLKVLNELRTKPEFHKAGAIAMFVGVVRGESQEGGKVQKLQIQAYENKANEVLEEICEDLKNRKGIIDVQIHHFVGEFQVGEDLVYVLVAGSHRDEVFPVLREAVERYKKEAPLFKKEFLIDEKGDVTSYWVSEKRNR